MLFLILLCFLNGQLSEYTLPEIVVIAKDTCEYEVPLEISLVNLSEVLTFSPQPFYIQKYGISGKVSTMFIRGHYSKIGFYYKNFRLNDATGIFDLSLSPFASVGKIGITRQVNDPYSFAGTIIFYPPQENMVGFEGWGDHYNFSIFHKKDFNLGFATSYEKEGKEEGLRLNFLLDLNNLLLENFYSKLFLKNFIDTTLQDTQEYYRNFGGFNLFDKEENCGASISFLYSKMKFYPALGPKTFTDNIVVDLNFNIKNVIFEHRLEEINSTATKDWKRRYIYALGYKNKIFNNMINLGGKINYYDKTFAPSFVLNFEKTFNFIVLSSNLRYVVKPPSITDLYWNETYFKGNPDLKNEKTYGIDLSFCMITSKFLKISFVPFYEYAYNLIIWEPEENFVWKPKNIEKTRTTGIESNLTFYSNFLKIWLTYTYQDPKVLSNNKTEFRNYIPLQILSTGANIKLFKKLIFAVSYRYTGKRFLNYNPENFQPQRYWLNPISEMLLSFSFKHQKTKIYFKLREVFGKELYYIPKYYLKKEKFEIGLKYVF